MDVRLLKQGDRKALDGFVAQHPYGGVEQSWGFGELQLTIPGRSAFYVFGLFDGTALKGSMLVVRQAMGAGKTWLWCPGGPLLPSSGVGWDLLRKAVEHLAREAGDVFLRIESRSEGVLGGQLTETSYLPRDTLLLDLTVGKAGVLGQMTQKGRYNIKQAEKHGVTVSEASDEDLLIFYLLLKETAERDGFFVHEFSFYKDFMAKLGDKAHLLLAKQNGTAVAGALLTHFGDVATYYFGASTMALGDSKAPYLVQWTAIQKAMADGLKTYDFLGIAPESTAGHPLQGVTQFKTRFGGKRVSYPEARVFVFRSFWWMLYRVAKRLKP